MTPDPTPFPCPRFALPSGKVLACQLDPGHPGRLCFFDASKPHHRLKEACR